MFYKHYGKKIRFFSENIFLYLFQRKDKKRHFEKSGHKFPVEFGSNRKFRVARKLNIYF